MVEKDAQAILQLLLRQGTLIDVLLVTITDQAILLESRLERCGCPEGCEEPATVTSGADGTGLKRCDRHAAEATYQLAKLIDAPTSEDQSWHDMEDAPRIRKIRDYVLTVKERKGETFPKLASLH